MAFIEEASRVRFILANPRYPGNIGSAARAIQTMGFGELWVVDPYEKEYRKNSEAHAFATHSVNVLEASRCVSTLEEALENVTKAYAMTGYDREYGPPMMDIATACEDAKKHLATTSSADIAFVFGTERSGLTNEQILLCQACAAIPANPECDSLNLAQAVQVAAYQAQITLRGTGLDKHAHRFEDDPPAQAQSIAGFFRHLEEAMVSCGALDPKQPKFMMQRLHRLFGRAGLTQPDVDMLRGICAAIICPKNLRQGRKISDKIARK